MKFDLFKIKTEKRAYDVEIEKYTNVENLKEEKKEFLVKEINTVLSDAWGSFPQDFVRKHVLDDKHLLIAHIDNEVIGFCAVELKKILDIRVHYVEFLVIKKKYQNTGLGPHLFYLTLKGIVLKNIFSILSRPLEIMFITPNIRVLSSMARFASYIYPNPYHADENGEIASADDFTWSLATELILQSDKPHRKIDREGLVLHGSYCDMPWLIYENSNIPWHKNNVINLFAKRYLGYGNGEDKEFVVRAHIGVFSFLKYIYRIIINNRKR